MTVEPLDEIYTSNIINLCLLSHVGCVRAENQDFFGRATFQNRELVVVCDGMGGHKGGSISSRIAVETMLRTFEAFAPQELNNQALLYHCIHQANQAIYQYAAQNTELLGMGTTVVAYILENNLITLAHIGDSRAYFFRKDRLHLLTFDHSQVFLSVKNGFMTFEEAEKSEINNILLAALGVDPELPFKMSDFVQSIPILLSQGDKILMCSDGLTGVNNFTEEQLIQFLQSNIHINAQTDQIMRFALNNQADDNVTVSLMEYTGANPLANETAIPPDVRTQYRKKEPDVKIQPVKDRTVQNAPVITNPNKEHHYSPKNAVTKNPAYIYGIIGILVLILLMIWQLITPEPVSQASQGNTQNSSNTSSQEEKSSIMSGLETDESTQAQSQTVTANSNRSQRNNGQRIGTGQNQNNNSTTQNETDANTENKNENENETTEQSQDQKLMTAAQELFNIAKPEIDQNMENCDTKLSKQPTWCPEKIESMAPNYKNFSNIYKELGIKQAFEKKVNEIEARDSTDEWEKIFKRLKNKFQTYGKNRTQQTNQETGNTGTNPDDPK